MSWGEGPPPGHDPWPWRIGVAIFGLSLVVERLAGGGWLLLGIGAVLGAIIGVWVADHGKAASPLRKTEEDETADPDRQDGR